MFTLLLLTRHGQDPLGHAELVALRQAAALLGIDLDVNKWPTVEDGEAAAQELRECGIGTDPGQEWRVVPIEDVDNYTLVD